MNRNLLLLVCLLPIFGYGQIIRPTPNIVEPNPGSYIHQLNNPTAFVTNAGTASASQQINFTTAQLSTSVVWTAGAGLEISKDNSTWSTTLTYANVVPSGSDHFFVRVAASTNAGTYSGNITAASSPATCNVPYSATVNSVSILNVNPTSLSGFTSTPGNLGGSQSYLLTGNSLTGNVTVGPLGGYKVSTDNSIFNYTLTLVPSSGAISQTVYVALSDTNTAGPHNGNLPNAGGGATPQYVALTGNTSAAATTPDSARFQFDTSSANDVAGWTIVRGDPSKHVISGTVPSTTITYTTVSTATANWGTFGSPAACVSPNNGVTNATIPDATNKGVMKEAVFNANLYSNTTAQFISGGWKTDGTTYDIELSGTTQFSVSGVGNYDVRGATLQTPINFQGSTNTSSKATWTAVAPDGSGNFTFYFGKLTNGEQIALLSYIKIKKH